MKASIGSKTHSCLFTDALSETTWKFFLISHSLYFILLYFITVTQVGDEVEGESSQHASNSEESDGSSDSAAAEQRRKKKKQRPVIPGERKSSRARKANATMVAILISFVQFL